MAHRIPLTLASWVAWTIFLMVSALNIIVGMVLQTLTLPFDPQHRTALMVNRLIWGKLLFLVELSFRIRRQGVENIGPGPYVMVCNHSSVLDIPSCMGLPLPLRVVGKTSLFRVPFMGWWMSYCKQIPLDAGNQESIDRFLGMARDTLAKGITVLVFPEGTRSADATLGRFNRGAFRLAKDSGVPVLPVAVYGSHFVMSKGSLPLKNLFTRIQVKVMAPLDSSQHSTARKLSNRTHEAIDAGLAELRKEFA